MKTLWFNTPRTRHFLVPDQQELAPGDFELRTSIGRRMMTTEEAVLPYEISREEATEWSRKELSRLLERKPKPEPDEEPAAASGETSDLPVFSAISGESAEDLRTDPEAFKRGLRNVGAELGAIFKDALSASPEDKARAQAKLEELRATLDTAKGAGPVAASGESDEDEASKRKAAEESLRSFADLAGSFAEAAERAGAKLAAAADELQRQRKEAPAEGESQADQEAETRSGDEGS